MIFSDETQKLFREKQFIFENEIVLSSGDLILAENVLSKDRRILNKDEVSPFLNIQNIREVKLKSQLLKG
jgi:hypothetical protein